MKKILLVLLISLFVVSFGACTINGNKSIAPSETEPAVFTEGWDNPYYDGVEFSAEAALSGVFP